jgi:hypothetical protein
MESGIIGAQGLDCLVQSRMGLVKSQLCSIRNRTGLVKSPGGSILDRTGSVESGTIGAQRPDCLSLNRTGLSQRRITGGKSPGIDFRREEVETLRENIGSLREVFDSHRLENRTMGT